MKVVFDDEALDDLQRIFAHIAQGNRTAAEDLISRIFDKAERLATPELRHMGRPGLYYTPYDGREHGDATRNGTDSHVNLSVRRIGK